MHPEAWRYAGHRSKQCSDSSDNSVHIQTDVITPDCFSEGIGPVSRVGAGILRAHVTGMEDSSTEFAGIRRNVLGVNGFANDRASIRNHRFIYRTL